MVDVMNTFVAIILSVVALTPIFLLVVLLNRTNVKPGTDPTVIKKLEDFDKRIADLEEKRTNVKGFKK